MRLGATVVISVLAAVTFPGCSTILGLLMGSGSKSQPKNDLGAPAGDEGGFHASPLNDSPCDLSAEGPGTREAAGAVLNDLPVTRRTLWTDGLEACAEAPANGCPACRPQDNGLVTVLRALDARAAAEGLAVPGGSLETYFRKAMQHPDRVLLASVARCADLPEGSCPRTAKGTVTLSRGRAQPCATPDGQVSSIPAGGPTAACPHLSIEADSLDAECRAFPLTFYGTRSASSSAETYDAGLPAASGDVSLTLDVPLVRDLPGDPASLSGPDLDRWLATLAAAPRLAVHVDSPRARLSVAPEAADAGVPAGCLQVQGTVRREDLRLALSAMPGGDALFQAVLPVIEEVEDRNVNGEAVGIPVLLSARLHDGTFASGASCAPGACAPASAPACDGDRLVAPVPDRCILPRPDGFVSGDGIAPVCVPATPATWTVDCRDAGATCAEGACTTAWRTPGAGDLVISELSIDPGPGLPQWFEVQNTGADPVDLSGLVLASAGGLPDAHRIRPVGPLVLGPGRALVLGPDADPATNGGIPVAYAYGPTIALDPATDALEIRTAEGEVLDRVAWTDGALVFGTAAAQLDPTRCEANANDDPAAWCAAVTPLPDGLMGTPGKANVPCAPGDG